jgi:16S rRNA (guanine(966)-N(2))-methyltransferase RsmD
MRIIAGKYKGRTLKPPPRSRKARPTTDSARETIFNIVESRFNTAGKIAVDLFCGTGGLGIECLSRGAAKCYFVDIDISLIKENVSALKIENISVIKKSDSLRFIKKFTPEEDYNDYYVIFADPPYTYSQYTELTEAAGKINCIFILEHSFQFIPDKSNNFLLLTRKSGITEFSIFDFRKNI